MLYGPSSVLGLYHKLKEGGASTDFPFLLGTTLHKELLQKFRGVLSPWRSYAMRSNLSDFKTHDRIILGEAPDLLDVEEAGGYEDSTLGEKRYQIALGTKGRTFTVTRKLVINDDKHAIQQMPQRFGRSAARTLAKKIVSFLEANALAYDGTAIFNEANHANVGHTQLTANEAGYNALTTGRVAIATATDPESGEKMGLKAKYLMVAPQKKTIAERLVNGSWVPVSTSGGSTHMAHSDLIILEEPFLTATNKWYLFAGPDDAPVLEVGFLQGKEDPDLLLKAATAVRVVGGNDPFDFPFDEIVYKVRHDWAVAAGYYQGAYLGNAENLA